jgi:enoyl-CoA hydratase/carnithine racemase
MTDELIKWRVEGHVGVATLNRPEALNTLNRDTIIQLTECIRRASGDPAIRVLVLGGEGERAFCAGGDLKARQREYESGDGDQLADVLRELFVVMDGYPRPLIAAIHGYCLGGGLELALACDLRVASVDTEFGSPEVTIGTMPAAGGTQRLPRLVGVARAKEIIFTGERFDAAKAYRIGLVNRLAAIGSSLTTAIRSAELIAQRAPLSVAHSKAAIDKSTQLDLQDGLAFEQELVAVLRNSHDRREGLLAFTERRPPKFTGE